MWILHLYIVPEIKTLCDLSSGQVRGRRKRTTYCMHVASLNVHHFNELYYNVSSSVINDKPTVRNLLCLKLSPRYANCVFNYSILIRSVAIWSLHDQYFLNLACCFQKYSSTSVKIFGLLAICSSIVLRTFPFLSFTFLTVCLPFPVYFYVGVEDIFHVSHVCTYEPRFSIYPPSYTFV